LADGVPRDAARNEFQTTPGSQRIRGRRVSSCTGTGISTRCPSATPVGLALGSDSPRAERPSPGTLGHSAEEVLTPLSLLMPAFSLERAPRLVCTTASMPARRSPTHCETQCRGFGSALEPRYIVGAKPLDQ